MFKSRAIGPEAYSAILDQATLAMLRKIAHATGYWLKWDLQNAHKPLLSAPSSGSIWVMPFEFVTWMPVARTPAQTGAMQ
jgi:hypothetical protein